MRRLMIACCLQLVSACGVSSQDEPQLIEESAPPTAIPSFTSATSPPPGTQPEVSTSSSVAPSSAPGFSGDAG